MIKRGPFPALCLRAQGPRFAVLQGKGLALWGLCWLMALTQATGHSQLTKM